MGAGVCVSGGVVLVSWLLPPVNDVRLQVELLPPETASPAGLGSLERSLITTLWEYGDRPRCGTDVPSGGITLAVRGTRFYHCY